MIYLIRCISKILGFTYYLSSRMKNNVRILIILSASFIVSGCAFTNKQPDNTLEPTTTPIINMGEEETLNEIEEIIASQQPTIEPTVEVIKDDVDEADVEITVDLVNYQFNPATIEVKPGQTVQLTLNNIEGTHDFVIDGLGVRTSQLNGAETKVVTFTIPADTQAGTTYEYYCSVGNHRAMGMTGILKIS